MNAKELTIDELDALLMEAGDPKVEAIANADAHTNNAGLPTYSELVAALRATSGQLADYHLKGHMTGWDKALADSHAMLRRIPA